MSSDSKTSTNTLQMVNESRAWEMNSNTGQGDERSSDIELENDPRKLKEFYREFCCVIRES